MSESLNLLLYCICEPERAPQKQVVYYSDFFWYCVEAFSTVLIALKLVHVLFKMCYSCSLQLAVLNDSNLNSFDQIRTESIVTDHGRPKSK